jgi:hypothetical protein
VLNVRAHDIDRTEQFEHTRAICYFVAWPYMGENRPSISEWWSLPNDPVAEIDEEMSMKYMRWITEQYAAGHGICSFEEYLENAKINN